MFKFGCCCCFRLCFDKAHSFNLVAPRRKIAAMQHDFGSVHCSFSAQPNPLSSLYISRRAHALVWLSLLLSMAFNKGSLSWLNFPAPWKMAARPGEFNVAVLTFRPNQSKRALYSYLFDQSFEFDCLERVRCLSIKVHCHCWFAYISTWNCCTSAVPFEASIASFDSNQSARPSL